MIGKTLALTRNMHLVTFSSLIHYLAKVRKDIKPNSVCTAIHYNSVAKTCTVFIRTNMFSKNSY